ncbi:hypothetical protein FOCC_FOCC003081 [Frankliniella occidentalis]|nr:hypothetical protein FOCC_FOCC003081 [Frankliniella occidentalis]
MKTSGTLHEGQSICVPSVTALSEQHVEGERDVGAASHIPAERIPEIRASQSAIGPRCLPEVCEVAPIAEEVTPTASIRVSPPAELTTASLAVGQTSTADLDIGSALSSGHTSLLAPPSGQEIPSPPPEPAGRDGGDGDFEVQQDVDEVEEAVDMTPSRSATFKSECLGSHPPTGQDDMQLGAPSKSQEKPSDVDKVGAEIMIEIGGEEQQSPGLPTEEERRGGQVGTASAETPLETGSGSPARDLLAVGAVQQQPPRALKNECIRDPGGAVPAVGPQDAQAQHHLNVDYLSVEHPVVRRDTPFPPLGVVGGPLDERIRSLTIDEPLLEEPEEEAYLPAGATSFRIDAAIAVPDAAAASSAAATSAAAPAPSDPATADPAAADPAAADPAASDPATADPAASDPAAADPAAVDPAAADPSEAAEMFGPSTGEAADRAPPLSGPTFCTCEDDRVPRRSQAARASLPGRETPAGPRPGDRMRRCSNCGEVRTPGAPRHHGRRSES